MAPVPLAPGAARMTIDPHTGTPFAAPPGRGAWQVLASGHWLMPARVADVVSYIQSHRPAGSTQTGVGSGSDGSWNERLSFPTLAGAVTSASVEIDLGPYGAAQTQFGAVVRVLWRPSWETIPADTRAVAVSVDRGRTLTVSGARTIAALRRVFARLSVVGPGAYSCPLALDSQTARVDLLDHSGRRLGSLNVQDVGCNWVYYRLGVRRGAPLWDNGILDLLWREGGVLACASAQLAATITPVSRSGSTASLAIAIRNTSHSACSLDGFPTVELLTAQSSRLATPVHRARGRAAPSSATARDAHGRRRRRVHSQLATQRLFVPSGAGELDRVRPAARQRQAHRVNTRAGWDLPWAGHGHTRLCRPSHPHP
jgi:hypothetical protein